MEWHSKTTNSKSEAPNVSRSPKRKTETYSGVSCGCLRFRIWNLGFLACLALALVTLRTNAADSDLPPRTLPTGPPLRPAISWVQTDLRIAHLPPADWRQISEFLKAGYQVIAVNQGFAPSGRLVEQLRRT